MNIIVTKDNVKIAEQSLVHKGEYNVNPLVFSFSQEYDGLSKMAVFSTLVKTYETAITNGSCIIPYEVLKDKGTLKIGVYGYTIENDVIVKRYSPTPITISINDGSYIPNASNPEQQNPTAFEEFMQQLETNLDEKQDVIDENNKIFSDFVNDINQNNKFVKTLTPPVIVKNLNSGIYYVPRGPIAYSNGSYLTSGDTILITTKDNYTNDVYFYHLFQALYEGQWLGAINVGVARANGTGTYFTINPANLLTKNYLTTTVTRSDDKIPTAKAVYDFVINKVPTKVSQLQNDSLYTTEQQVEDMISALGSVFVLKGSVDTVAELPMQDNKLGDVYYVKSESAGYVWIEDDGVERWEELGLTIDTSDFLTKSELAQTTGVATNNAMSQAGVTNVLATKQNIIDNNNKLSADLVGDATTTNKFVTSAEKTAWNNKSDFSGNYNDLTNKPDLTIYEEKTDAEEKYNTLLAQIPTATATGETINVQDSSNLPIQEFSMLGNATQFTTTGKNLFNKEDVINAYLNNDGTTTNNNSFRTSDYIDIAGASKVTVSGYVGSSELCCFYDSSKGHLSNFSIGGSSYTTMTATVPNDAVYIRVTIKKDYLNTFQLEKSASATSYEPYTGGTPAPNPDYPQDIHVVTGDNTVILCGSQLANITNYTDTKQSVSISCTDNVYNLNGTTDGSGAIIGGATTETRMYLASLPAGTYTCALVKKSGTVTKTSGSAALYVRKSSNNTIVANTNFSVSADNHVMNFTLDESTDVFLQFYINSQGWTFTNYNFEVIVTPGTYTASNLPPFSPYTPLQTQLLSLGSIELAKIGDYTDRIYKQDGKWYVEKQVGEKVLDGSENWSKSSNTSVDRFVLGNSLYQVSTNSLCNLFQTVERGTTTVGTWYNNTGTQLIFNYTAYGTTTLEQWKTWLASNNIIAYQPLKTPTITEITDTTLIGQLENILAMHTNKNVTNAWIEPSGTNAQGGLTVKYYQDLETLTDKISNLEARVSLLE